MSLRFTQWLLLLTTVVGPTRASGTIEAPPPDDVDPVGFGGVRINYDDSGVDRFYESAPETQDSDHAPIDRGVGTFRTEAGLGSAIQELDWSETGVNDALE